MTIPTDIAEVLAGIRPWACACCDNITLASELPDKCVDLVMGSPPYETRRTYGIGFDKRGQEWVDWMVLQWHQWQRICKGPVCMVVEGMQEDFAYSATPMLLAADLYRAGFTLRKPPIYYRFGISGSGGEDWFRNDYEFVLVTTPGGKLAWSDNTACGHPPKWAPGGEMSYRLTEGTRRNQWGGGKKSGSLRKVDGGMQAAGRLSHVMTERPGQPAVNLFGEELTERPRTKKGATSGYSPDGDVSNDREYTPPTLANPGNVIIPPLPEDSSLIKCKVGGGVMGNKKCHENEAPFPEMLPERLIRSLCPPGGIVFDPFAGSGTTLAVAVRWRRRAIGTDVRQSQVDLTTSRCLEETPMLDGII